MREGEETSTPLDAAIQKASQGARELLSGVSHVAQALGHLVVAAAPYVKTAATTGAKTLAAATTSTVHAIIGYAGAAPPTEPQSIDDTPWDVVDLDKDGNPVVLAGATGHSDTIV